MNLLDQYSGERACKLLPARNVVQILQLVDGKQFMAGEAVGQSANSQCKRLKITLLCWEARAITGNILD
ncbi:hypothetical protein DRQ53_00625 [bacterium]|nr:MAG: hypothetical protein DRQ53_00625 [bacterium]RLA42623.1 MAG: hypothetical protein DRQ97_13760 [Gammaproteobacteria bacterium]